MHHVYIIAAEADGDVANELGEFLKRHGCVVRVETGGHFYPPARPNEKTVALWSFNTRMSARQIIFTNRAIDGLTGAGLVVAQLDMHALPRGLSDIPVVDLKFPAARTMKYHDVRKALDALRDAPPEEPPAEISERLEQSADEAPDSAPSMPSGRAMSVEGPAETGSDSRRVFVSYAVKNAETVYPLAKFVESLGLDVWIDRDDLKGGDNWAGMIVRAIRSAKTFCLMCSAAAFDSDNVRREVYIADKYKIPLLPVRLDKAVMPEDIEYFLIDRQWIDLVGLDDRTRQERLRKALNV